MTRMVRWGVIGLGVGQRLAAEIDADPRCHLAVICDFDPERLAALSQQFPRARCERDAQAVLEDPSTDAVVIASWDNFHFEQTRTAILAGKHVFTEKPFVVREEEALEVRALLRQRPAQRFSSNLVLRSVPRFRELRQMIVNGALGRLYHLEGDYEYGRLEKITHGWRGQLPFYSAVHGGGVHIADLLMWLSGERIEEVTAYGNAIASAGSGFGNFDMVVAALRFSGGAVGKLAVNFGSVKPHFHRLMVYGTEGVYENRPQHALLYNSREAGAEPRQIDTAYPGNDRKADVIRSFIDAVVDGGEVAVSVDDVFASMSVCFAIEQSAHEKRTVPVRYL